MDKFLKTGSQGAGLFGTAVEAFRRTWSALKTTRIVLLFHTHFAWLHEL